MVLEVALIDVLEGSEADFPAAFAGVKHVLTDSPGALSVRMTGGVETPTRFVLLIEWESIEAHKAFMSGPSFAAWRGGVGSLFARPPVVEHFTDLG